MVKIEANAADARPRGTGDGSHETTVLGGERVCPGVEASGRAGPLPVTPEASLYGTAAVPVR